MKKMYIILLLPQLSALPRNDPRNVYYLIIKDNMKGFLRLQNMAMQKKMTVVKIHNGDAGGHAEPDNLL